MTRRFYPPTESDILHNFVDGRVYADTHRERIRAHKKHDPSGNSAERREYTDEGWWLKVLGEEYGEVCRALCDGSGKDHLYEELIQLAAMTLAWADAVTLDQGEIPVKNEEGDQIGEVLTQWEDDDGIYVEILIPHDDVIQQPLTESSVSLPGHSSTAKPEEIFDIDNGDDIG